MAAFGHDWVWGVRVKSEGHLLCGCLGPLVERDIKWEDGGLTGNGCSGGGER